MLVEQGNRVFFGIEGENGHVRYFVHKIDGKHTSGKQGTYTWLKCPMCGKIVGTQFNGFGKHTKACGKTNL